jgi:hypothetical protein
VYWVIGSALVVIALGALYLWIAYLFRRLSRSRLVIRRFDNPAFNEIRCPSCTYGAQYLHPTNDTRGPIPVSVRMIIKGRSWIGTSQANILKCNDCGGNGWTSTRDKKVENTGLREIWS